MKIRLSRMNVTIDHIEPACSRVDGVTTCGPFVPRYTPIVTTASTPEAWSASAGRYARNGESSESAFSTTTTCGMCLRTNAISHPTINPIATPLNPVSTKLTLACNSEKLPATTAATASRYATSAVASLISPSPSRIVVTSRGVPSGRSTAVAATGSGGETIAPSTNASGQPTIGARKCTTAATAHIVTTTSPVARRTMGPK